MQTAVVLEVQQLPWALFYSLMVCEPMMPADRAGHAANAHCMQIGAIKTVKKARGCSV